MMDQLVQASPYVHIFEAKGMICLYHSLYIQNIYGRQIMAKVFETFKQPLTISQARSSLKSENGQVEDLIEELLSLGFLRYITDRKEEELLHHLWAQANKQEIRFLYLVPTSACNFRCRYCHIIDTWANYGYKNMSEEVAKAGIDRFIELSSSHQANKEIMFYGGEPLLNSRLIQYAVSYIRQNEPKFNAKVNITIFTNGTNINQKMAEFLAGHGVFIIVSIDGQPSAHNQMRVTIDNHPSFDQVIKGYKVYKEAGCRVGISMVLGSHNLPGLTKHVEYLVEELKPIDLGFSTLHLMSTRQGFNPAQVETDLLTREIIETFKVIRQKGVYAEHIFRRVRPFVERELRLKDCPSCGGKLLVAPDSTIGFCEAFLGTGRYSYPLSSFNLNNEGYKQWANLSPVNRPECLKCPAISICGGGCPYDAWVLNGSINSLDTRRCEQAKTLLEWLIWDLFEQIDKSDREWIVPSDAQRKGIYSQVGFANLPLQGYSTYGEK